MAINIFSGANSQKTGTAASPRVSSAASRAAATTAAVGGNAVASNSGSTAVRSDGILGKVGGLVNNVSGLLAHVPGPVGAIAGLVNGLTSTNDPEWWNTVPGDGLTTNAPLQTLQVGTNSSKPMMNIRPVFLDILSSKVVTLGGQTFNGVTSPGDTMVTQYLMPAVRKVVNAVVLQDAADYKASFVANCSLYAMWRQLLKYDFFLKHGVTFVPNLNDPAFPLFMNINASWLQSTITRLEEYLHANVRLPHTMCEYLTWRYGRTYRTNASAKAGFVMYDALPQTDSTTDWDSQINACMSAISGSPSIQKANVDLYNAYLDHDQEVLLDDATQCTYDCKEFVLRTNLDIIADANLWDDIDASPIIMDSNLDNPTVFMASTTSCFVKDSSGATNALFPVSEADIYLFDTLSSVPSAGALSICCDNGTILLGADLATKITTSPGENWLRSAIHPQFFTDLRPDVLTPQSGFMLGVAEAFLCKAMDFYEVGIFVPVKAHTATGAIGTTSNYAGWADMTAIAIDTGSVPDGIISNEQVFAFANLVAVEAKDKTTYKQVEKRAAKDVANFVESNSVAALAPSTVK